MLGGLNKLHNIDSAIAEARKSVSQASKMPEQISQALVEVKRQQSVAFDKIAAERLSFIESGQGGSLGYVDRQAEKLLAEHQENLIRLDNEIRQALAEIEKLENKRRKQENIVAKAVDRYDKAVASSEAKLLKDAYYMGQLERVETAETILVRAEQKHLLAQENEKRRSSTFTDDPFFAYLEKRNYGKKNAKGWGLTRWLDHWVARISNYRHASETHNRLKDIPLRLAQHVKILEENVEAAQLNLQSLEDEILKQDGVAGLYEKSISEQNILENIDSKIVDAEENNAALQGQHSDLSTQENSPYRAAIKLLSDNLQRLDQTSLSRLASQTQTREDDDAISDLRKLSREATDLADDQVSAREILKKHQKTLKELENVRQRFKSRRYDAPSSVFDREDILSVLLRQVVSGVLSGDDFWRQIQRAQRTARRYSDYDFGGGDWSEGLRLPRSNRPGGWGTTTRRRTSIPRQPRQSLPRSTSNRRKGGFRTGGGF